jgi:NADPH:quinone reductase-like Zn-dependent oxidoreductase
VHRISAILAIVLVLVFAGLAVFGYVLSRNAPCTPAPSLAAGAQLMRAVIYRCYGGPEVMHLEQIARPGVADGRVLVKVHAAALNPLDVHYLRGTPYIVRLQAGLGVPSDPLVAEDFAGTVTEIGNGVTRFTPGDEVFGGYGGSLAEYLSIKESGAIALKPANVSFEQAAGSGIAAVTALQALRDQGQLRAGQKVLINGASGGVGTFAVQIAKALGGEVTGVTSTRNLGLVQSLGADHVIDYTREDYTASGAHYDLIIDAVGNHSFRDNRRALTHGGTLIVIGGSSAGQWLGPLVLPIKALLLRPFVSQKISFFIAHLNQQDLVILGELMRSGKLVPVVDRQFSLQQAADAMRYLELGHARGKVIVNVE